MTISRTLIMSLVLVLAISCASVRKGTTVEHTYANKSELIIDSSPISRYEITASSDENVHIRLRNADDPTCEYTILETETALRLGDKDLHYDPHRPTPRDIYQWTLEVPKNMEVEFVGGVVRLNVDSFDGSISVATGLGTMTFKDSKGTFKISTGVGDIDLDHCEGTFSVVGGQADINASKIVIEGESLFLTNGGDVDLLLATTPTNNITIATGTGRGVLDYSGNTVVGNFTFSAEKGKGNIRSPYPFEREETYKDDLKMIRKGEEFGKEVDYLLKEHVIGNSSPVIVMKTVRGSVVLKK